MVDMQTPTLDDAYDSIRTPSSRKKRRRVREKAAKSQRPARLGPATPVGQAEPPTMPGPMLPAQQPQPIPGAYQEPLDPNLVADPGSPADADRTPRQIWDSMTPEQQQQFSAADRTRLARQDFYRRQAGPETLADIDPSYVLPSQRPGFESPPPSALQQHLEASTPRQPVAPQNPLGDSYVDRRVQGMGEYVAPMTPLRGTGPPQRQAPARRQASMSLDEAMSTANRLGGNLMVEESPDGGIVVRGNNPFFDRGPGQTAEYRAGKQATLDYLDPGDRATATPRQMKRQQYLAKRNRELAKRERRRVANVRQEQQARAQAEQAAQQQAQWNALVRSVGPSQAGRLYSEMMRNQAMLQGQQLRNQGALAQQEAQNRGFLDVENQRSQTTRQVAQAERELEREIADREADLRERGLGAEQARAQAQAEAEERRHQERMTQGQQQHQENVAAVGAQTQAQRDRAARENRELELAERQQRIDALQARANDPTTPPREKRAIQQRINEIAAGNEPAGALYDQLPSGDETPSLAINQEDRDMAVENVLSSLPEDPTREQLEAAAAELGIRVADVEDYLRRNPEQYGRGYANRILAGASVTPMGPFVAGVEGTGRMLGFSPIASGANAARYVGRLFEDENATRNRRARRSVRGMLNP